MGPVKFFITRKCSAKVLSPMSNLGVGVDMGFFDWSFATWISKLGGSVVDFEDVAGRLLFDSIQFSLSYCTHLGS